MPNRFFPPRPRREKYVNYSSSFQQSWAIQFTYNEKQSSALNWDTVVGLFDILRCTIILIKIDIINVFCVLWNNLDTTELINMYKYWRPKNNKFGSSVINMPDLSLELQNAFDERVKLHAFRWRPTVNYQLLRGILSSWSRLTERNNTTPGQF